MGRERFFAGTYLAAQGFEPSCAAAVMGQVPRRPLPHRASIRTPDMREVGCPGFEVAVRLTHLRLELALAMQAMRARVGLTEKALAGRLGVNQPAIASLDCVGDRKMGAWCATSAHSARSSWSRSGVVTTSFTSATIARDCCWRSSARPTTGQLRPAWTGTRSTCRRCARRASRPSGGTLRKRENHAARPVR